MSKNKSKVKMPSDKLNKCHGIIHTATVAAGAAGAIPIPLSDAIPIGAAQVAMIVGLGKVFELTIGSSAAKSIAGVGVASLVGRTIASSILKFIPGVGSIVGAATAVTITETLGWIIADDFYRISIGEEPEDIVGAADGIVGLHDRVKNKQ
ncbi:hypothetical protein FACS1894105_11550 [Clostridia bacterium]|nr:hypothetical protein FACS1894105_11550 [Clostridia bacterium]